jgi:hypothetical protein
MVAPLSQVMLEAYAEETDRTHVVGSEWWRCLACDSTLSNRSKLGASPNLSWYGRELSTNALILILLLPLPHNSCRYLSYRLVTGAADCTTASRHAARSRACSSALTCGGEPTSTSDKPDGVAMHPQPRSRAPPASPIPTVDFLPIDCYSRTRRTDTGVSVRLPV